MTRMSEKLPEAFMDRMRKLLGDEYDRFMAVYGKERFCALRYNPLKSTKEDFLRKMPFALTRVEWSEEGFYYENEEQPGKHVFHEAGAYYMQEPSAMAAAQVLNAAPGEKILDLCAAPGGKTTHIAGRMMGKGLLVTNEIVPKRAKILSQNVERMGISNAVVCNETPERLAEFFPHFFDKILVDAPCSGEGMFRKEDAAIDMWSPENVLMCAKRQLMILEQAAKMLKAGGVLVYSTCTFSPDENERVISEFLSSHSDFVIEESVQEKFFAKGEGTWIENPAKGIEHTMRLWPHKIKGEGHFIAKLKREGSPYPKEETGYSGQDVMPKPAECKQKNCHTAKKKADKQSVNLSEAIGLCRDFLSNELGIPGELQEELEQNGTYVLFGEQLYLVPSDMVPLQNLKIVRAGLHLGTNKKNRFEPSHALALYLRPDMAGRSYAMSMEEAAKYLRGETFACDDKQRGWFLLTIDGYSLGFGKAVGGQMKNHYPVGLRKM